MDKVKVYKNYFETASDNTPLVMHRGYALSLVKMVEQQEHEYITLSQSIEEDDTIIGQLQENLSQANKRIKELEQTVKKANEWIGIITGNKKAPYEDLDD